MKKLCPICELWLVEVQMIDGEGRFHCVRCETTDVFLPVNSEIHKLLALKILDLMQP